MNANIDYREIGQRIKQLRGGESQSDFGKRYDKSYTDIGRIERGEVKPTPDLLYKICTDYRKAMDWLLTGEDMLRGAGSTEEESSLYVNVKKLDIFTLAGAGRAKELTEYEPIDSIYLPAAFAVASIIPIKVRGESMYPLIHDGAIVGVDRQDREIVSGEIYAVWFPYEGAVIKRLFMGLDRVEIKSDNPSFPTLLIPLEELDEHFIQGRVKWIIQRI